MKSIFIKKLGCNYSFSTPTNRGKFIFLSWESQFTFS